MATSRARSTSLQGNPVPGIIVSIIRGPRLHGLADGRVRVHLKSPSRRGVAFADMSVDTFLSRLCALVPPPRFHMTRYYGVFASHHRLRARVIPSSPQPPAPTQLSLLFAPGLPDELREATSTARRVGWASLLARVFAVDVTVCSKCGGKMRILEVVTDPEAITELLYAYLMKEALAAIFDSASPDELHKLLLDWLDWVEAEGKPPLVRAAETIAKHFDGVVAYLEVGATNALTEGLNRKARVVTSRAYGFRRVKSFMSMLLLCCGGIVLPWPHVMPL
ncbi:MAG: transposase [Thiolinea sp.]